jgi:hypothetical protein
LRRTLVRFVLYSLGKTSAKAGISFTLTQGLSLGLNKEASMALAKVMT